MNFGRLLVISFGTSWLTDASFASLCLWISDVFDFACLLAGLGWLALSLFACFVSVFDLFCPFFDSPWLLTCFEFQLAFCLFGLRLVCSRCLCLWALAVNSLGGLIIFRMLGAYVDSSRGTLIPAFCVHYRRRASLSLIAPWSFIPSPLAGSSYADISSDRLITLVKGRYSANDSSRLIGEVSGEVVNPNSITRCSTCPYRGFVLVAFLHSDYVIGILGHYWELGSPHAATVCFSSLQMWSVLQQAMSIFLSS